MKLLCSSLFLLCTSALAPAATTSVSYTPNMAIPDGSTIGASDTQTVSSPILSIDSVTVTLTLTGGFNGDYYIYLQHDSGFSVLVNRPGVTADDDLGYAQSGMTVTFQDGAANGDFHLYEDVRGSGPGPVTGTWEPDARTTTLTDALDTDPRSAFLSTFNGLNANGNWTLFAADRSSGGLGVLTSWTLTINGTTVPEPAAPLLFLLLTTGTLLTRRRRWL